MLRKMFILVALATIAVFCANGCKKKPDQSPPTKTGTVVKEAVDYKAKAEKEITEENMDGELAKLEKEIEAETRTAP
ncbi:MAG TPA: hypothetical protein VMX13_15405 [Sedimentisphaerales bacterium]|nr:hypothetical protein [Sedimentisphaerales bacterium]